MAVTFTYCPTKNRKYFGIYVKAIGGDALKELKNKLSELPNDFKGACPVVSDRICRVTKESKAKKLVKRLNSLPENKAIDKIRFLFIKPKEKDFAIIKAQYYQLHRLFDGAMSMQFTTQNKSNVEKVALNYAENKTPTKLVPTVAKNMIVSKRAIEHKETYNPITKQITETGLNSTLEIKPEISKGGRKGELNPNKRTIYTKRK